MFSPELGHELKFGNPVLIRARSRHKSDKRDADLILDLLVKDEFPALWRRPVESQSILEQLRFRYQLVKQRTQVCNRLQVLAHAAGLPKRVIQTNRARKDLAEAILSETLEFQRDQLFELLDDLTKRIKVIESQKVYVSRQNISLLIVSKSGVFETFFLTAKKPHKILLDAEIYCITGPLVKSIRKLQFLDGWKNTFNYG